MKQLTKMGMLLAFGGILASCSNDNIDTPNVGNEQLPTDGKMYAAINIAMPGVTGSRAVTEYGNGEKAEYAATSGWIYLFQDVDDESEEDKYKCVAGVKLASLAWDTAKDGEITTSSTTATAAFENIDPENETYYALVVLNKSENFPEPIDMTAEDPSTTAMTFGNWKVKAHANVGDLENGGNFVMTNAPGLEEGLSYSDTPLTLAELDSDCFSSSPKNLTPAAKIYVQREVAKVEMVNGTADGKKFEKFGVDDTEGKDFVRFDAWVLDVTANEVYPVQVIDGIANIDGWSKWLEKSTYYDAFFSASTTFGRVWWAIDPTYNDTENNYNTAIKGKAFNHYTDADVSNALIGDDAKLIEFARENTMNYVWQDLNQTTAVLLKATYYVAPAGGTVPATGAGTSFVTYGTLKLALPDGVKAQGDNGQDRTTGAYQAKLSDLFKDEALKTMQSKLGDVGDDILVDYYHNGVCYYRVPIRHFEDEEETAELPENWLTSSDDYPSIDYLGRFGLLRNNWYQININSVSGLGDPTIPEDPGNTPDDPKSNKYYINATINILAWAKRSHDYDL